MEWKANSIRFSSGSPAQSWGLDREEGDRDMEKPALTPEIPAVLIGACHPGGKGSMTAGVRVDSCLPVPSSYAGGYACYL